MLIAPSKNMTKKFSTKWPKISLKTFATIYKIRQYKKGIDIHLYICTYTYVYKIVVHKALIVKIFYIIVFVFREKCENIDKWFSILHYINHLLHNINKKFYFIWIIHLE